ncbi:MAG: hypothetical protein JWP82_1086 [Humibacillus sp.]|nr:hypothetical protein [Humibacillus sp.]
MSQPVGDPASVSALGGALRTQAVRLADLAVDLSGQLSGAHRPTSRSEPTAHERALLERAATELDRIGGLLQAWTATSVETAARARRLEPELERADLVVDGHLVVEPPGPSRVDPATRASERTRLQELLNRVTAVQSRELARVRRELEQSRTSLAAVSLDAREGPAASA